MKSNKTKQISQTALEKKLAKMVRDGKVVITSIEWDSVEETGNTFSMAIQVTGSMIVNKGNE